MSTFGDITKQLGGKVIDAGEPGELGEVEASPEEQSSNRIKQLAKDTGLTEEEAKELFLSAGQLLGNFPGS